MDTIAPTFMLIADRPLLGAMALAACLAGGSGSHGTVRPELSGTPHRIDSARFAPGWEKGAPAAPQAAVTALQLHLAGVRAGVTAEVRAEVRRAQASVSAVPRRALAAVAPIPYVAHSATVAWNAAAPVVTPASLPVLTLPVSTMPEPAALVSGTAIAAPPASAVPAIALPADVAADPASLTAVTTVAAVPVSSVPAATLLPRADTAGPPQPLQIVSSPELRRFDLASFRKPAAQADRPAARLAASRKASTASGAKARPADRLIDDVVYHQAAIMVGGKSGGDIAVRIGPDMKPSVKVGDLLGLVAAQLDPESLARFSQASSAGDYVSFATLRTAGFDVSYNAAADSIAISVAP